MTHRGRTVLWAQVLTGALMMAAGCGKEGPPLAPLRLVPAPVSDISARRTASEVQLRFVLPNRNQNGPGPVDLSRVEIYAVTIAPGATAPDNREFFAKDRLVGSIAVQPPAEEDEPAADRGTDRRPAHADAAIFIEELTPQKLQPAPSVPAAAPPAGTESKAEGSAYPVRVYALRGVSRSGRAGPPAPRLSVPLVDPPAPPSDVQVKFTERTFVVSWLPPVVEPGGAPVAFNVYATEAPGRALNASPVAKSVFDQVPVRFDVEHCFAIRSVQTIQDVPIESASSSPACVTARDIFPPARPEGLTVVAAPEGISLSWSPNAEPDLAGYIVLRSDDTGIAFQALTPEPIRDTNYRDTAVQSGMAYVYRLVAVDKAKPPNTSEQSLPERVVAR